MGKSTTAFKGFDKDLKCLKFQYKVGETYEHQGEVEPCSSGFHACTHPLDVFGYYPPADSRFCIVECEDYKKHDDDSKIASARITIHAEVTLHEYITKAVEYIFSKAKKVNKRTNSGVRGAASNSGDYGAASNSGYCGAASTKGKHSVAMHCGYSGRVKGMNGNALFLCERNSDWEIINAWSGIVGKDGIKEDTFYRLEDGKPVETE